MVSDLAEFGQVRRSVLGVTTEPNDPERVAQGRTPPGVRVTSVAQGSPAEGAGLRVGDVIVKVGDRLTTSPASVRAAVEFAPVGVDLALSIHRDGQDLTLNCKPGLTLAEIRQDPRPPAP